MSNGDVFRVDEELNAVVQRIQGSRRRLETFRTVEPDREICLNPDQVASIEKVIA